VASTSMFAMLGINSALSAKAEGKYQSAIYGKNAQISRMRADDAIERGVDLERRSRIATNQLLGEQIASMGAQGIDLGFGTAIDIQHDTIDVGALDIMTIRNNASKEAWGFLTESMNYNAQAKVSKIAANNKAVTSLVTAGLLAAKSYKDNH